MEVVVKETGPTRQSRRERTLTTKALELEGTKQGEKSGAVISIVTPSQRSSEPSEWNESDEHNSDDGIVVRAETPDAPRPRRVRRRPTTPPRPTAGCNMGAKTTKDDPLSSILIAIEELKSSNAEIKATNAELSAGARQLLKELADVRNRLIETQTQLSETQTQLSETQTQLAETQTQLAEIASPSNGSASGTSKRNSSPQSYASVLTRSINPSSSASQPGARAVSSTRTDTLYCTVDTSRIPEENKSKAQPGTIREGIEKEMRTTEGRANWRCAAVIRDARNSDRIRIACRDEAELQQVKEAVEKVAVTGTRVLRDQLYPIKVDNANRTAILDQEGKVLPGAVEILGKENNVQIAKIAWLSKKDSGKAYGSVVIYLTKGSDAARLLQEQYFHIAGESGYTGIFEPRNGPKQCYRCQELGHKAFSCTKSQICGKCAQQGHHHSECQEVIPKCVPCGGPHESFSRNCRVLYPTQHE
jgi:hypothetical protein